MKDIALKVVADLVEKVKAVPEFGCRAWSLIDEDQLSAKSIGFPLPCASVVYEGIRSNPSGSMTDSGKSSEVSCAIYLLYQVGTFGGVDNKPRSLYILDQIRNQILGTRSPTGHNWMFKMESPGPDINKALVYYQRWAAKVIL